MLQTLQVLLFMRGTKQIRTVVEAFAELCLATRPWYQKISTRTSFRGANIMVAGQKKNFRQEKIIYHYH